MFKKNIGKNPSVFLDVFTKATSNYNTRNKSKYIPKLYFNSLCQQSISYRGPIFWNKVPSSLKKNNKVWGLFAKTRDLLTPGLLTSVWNNLFYVEKGSFLVLSFI